jgi:hypothetical protein
VIENPKSNDILQFFIFYFGKILPGKEKAEWWSFIDDLAILSKKKYERQNIEACFYILGYPIGTFCRISGISKNKINW